MLIPRFRDSLLNYTHFFSQKRSIVNVFFAMWPILTVSVITKDMTVPACRVKEKVPPRFELGSRDSESLVLTATLWNQEIPVKKILHNYINLKISLVVISDLFNILTYNAMINQM